VCFLSESASFRHGIKETLFNYFPDPNLMEETLIGGRGTLIQRLKLMHQRPSMEVLNNHNWILSFPYLMEETLMGGNPFNLFSQRSLCLLRVLCG